MIAFLIGFFVGAGVGFVICALVVTNTIEKK